MNCFVTGASGFIGANLVHETRGLILIHRVDGFQNLHLILMLPACIDERSNIFGEAAASKTDATTGAAEPL